MQFFDDSFSHIFVNDLGEEISLQFSLSFEIGQIDE